MTEATHSQSQQPQDVWAKMVEEGTARFESAFGEAARLEAAAVEQMTSNFDQIAKLQKETLTYMTQLTAEWRKLSLEAARRATSFGKVTG